MRKIIRNRLLAVGISLGGMALLGELAVRLAVGAPWVEREPLLMVRANRHRGWEMERGLHYTYDRPVHVNQLGLRGPELADKKPGEQRVLVLGDSFVYGQGSADGETVPAYLEGFLRERSDRPVTVVNGGHRAYALHQELGLLRELGSRIQPDEVLVLWFWNDATENDLALQFERLTESGPRPFDLRGSLESWHWRWRVTQVLRRSALLMWTRDALRGRQHDGKTPMTNEEYAERFTQHLAVFQELSEGAGFRLRFAVVPDPFGLRGPHRSHEVEAVVLEILTGAGVEVIDLHGPLATWVGDDPLPVIPHDGHYGPEANRVLARALADALAP